MIKISCFLLPLLLGTAGAALPPTTVNPIPVNPMNAPPLTLDGACKERPGPSRTADALPASRPSVPLPAVVSGRVAFYAVRTDALGRAQEEVTLGNVDRTLPLASAYKTAVLYGALKDVDSGRLSLTQTFVSTALNRSIEDYPAGRNSLLTLARRAIRSSDNTAADILHLAVTPPRIAALASSLDPCANVYLTSKALWSALAGLSPAVIDPASPETMLRSARAYAALPAPEKLRQAAVLNARAQTLHPDLVLRQLERYFAGPYYTPDNDTSLLNSSTPRGWAGLMGRAFLPGALKPGSSALFKQIMATGCCNKPTTPVPFALSYWGSKAGSGWRLLVLTGHMELPGGAGINYAYVNTESGTQDSLEIERQIRPVLNWIVASVAPLGREDAGKTAGSKR